MNAKLGEEASKAFGQRDVYKALLVELVTSLACMEVDLRMGDSHTRSRVAEQLHDERGKILEALGYLK